LRQAVSIKERIESLQAELSAITGNRAAVPVEAPENAQTAPKWRRRMSASAKARIAAAQRARWARFHAKKGRGRKSEAAPTTGRKMSRAWRAKIAAAARARWAKAKAAGRNAL